MPGPRRPQIFGAGLGVPECEITLQWWRALQELQRKTSYKHDQTYWLFSFICLIFVRPQEVLLLELQGFEWFSITLHARVCANLGIQTRLHVQGRLFNRRGEPVVVGRWQFEKAQVGKQVCWDVKSLRGKKMLERSWVSLFRPIKYHIYIHIYIYTHVFRSPVWKAKYPQQDNKDRWRSQQILAMQCQETKPFCSPVIAEASQAEQHPRSFRAEMVGLEP